VKGEQFPEPGLDGRHLDAWFLGHAERLAWVVVLMGFLARLWTASGTFLNSDEAMHFLAANRQSLARAYQGSLELAHPPLLVLLLYFWRHLGTSELLLRLPSVIAGTGFCWFSYQWLNAVFSRSAAFLALVLASFLPPMIGLSAEVRQYALLLCFVAASAFYLERALAAKSAASMALFAVFLYLSVLSHYSGLLFAGAAGLYSVLRMVGDRPSRPCLLVWVLVQAGLLALSLFLYRTHLSYLRSSGVAQQMIEDLMRNSYFHPGHDRLLWFVFARTFGVFQYVFGQNAIGDLAGVLFFIGLIQLLRGKVVIRKSVDPRLLAAFLLLPFAINCAAAVVDLYPYGGTRHSSFLAMFAIAGTTLPLEKWSGERVIQGLVAAVVAVAACHGFGAPHRPYMRRPDQSLANMAQAMAAIRHEVPVGAPIFVDPQTSLLLRQYLCPDAPEAVDTQAPRLRTYACLEHPVILARSEAWIISAPQFLDRWQDVLSVAARKPGEPVWVFQAGWDIGLAGALRRDYPELRDLAVESFGRNISLFELTAGQPMPAPFGRRSHSQAGQFDCLESPRARSVSSSGTGCRSCLVTTPNPPL
jgi:4-amino-4-deoxy-L-arabinose transferase-like glycosyltransferase